MSEPRVLIIDDEPDMVDNCARILRRAGHRCLITTDPHRALALLESERPDLVLTDLNMPEIDGLGVLRRARKLDPALPMVVITAFATIESAVAAIKDRAFDYLPKNFSVDQLTLLVERALRQRRLALENRKPARSATDHRGPGNVRELQNVIERACALAEGDAITSRDLPEHVRGRRRHIEVPDAVAIPTETQIAGANDLGLKEAKERWMAVLEASYLRQLLDRHEDNISAAAKVAGIDRKTFHRLVTKHRIRS